MDDYETVKNMFRGDHRPSGGKERRYISLTQVLLSLPDAPINNERAYTYLFSEMGWILAGKVDDPEAYTKSREKLNNYRWADEVPVSLIEAIFITRNRLYNRKYTLDEVYAQMNRLWQIEADLKEKINEAPEYEEPY
jgi:hypothetical protein